MGGGLERGSPQQKKAGGLRGRQPPAQGRPATKTCTYSDISGRRSSNKIIRHDRIAAFRERLPVKIGDRHQACNRDIHKILDHVVSIPGDSGIVKPDDQPFKVFEKL